VATARSFELRALAQRVADRLPAAAAEIVLTGSASRGVADELSDIEMLVAAEELPPLDTCVEWAGAAGLADVQTWSPPDAPIWWLGGVVDGVQVELIWWRRAFVEERVARTLAAEIVEHQRLRTAEALVNGVALRGDALAQWQERLRVYPDALADAVIADAADVWNELPATQLTLLRPGDGLALSERLVEDAQTVLRIVFAVNRVWEPGWKRLASRVEPLALKPDRLAERIDAALATNDLRAMKELVRDTLAFAPDTPTVVRARAQVDALLVELG
jgi:hypothetical protein